MAMAMVVWARGACLLLCLVASTRPFGNDVFFGFGVRGKGKCDAGEGCAKVDTDNELGLGATLALDLCEPARRAAVCGGRAVRARRRRRGAVGRLLAVRSALQALGRISRRARVWRVAHGLLLLGVARASGVDGRQRACRAAVVLLWRRWGAQTGLAAGGRIGVRRRAAEGVLGVHGERAAARVLRRLRGRMGGRAVAVGGGSAGRGRRLRGVVERALALRAH